MASEEKVSHSEKQIVATSTMAASTRISSSYPTIVTLPSRVIVNANDMKATVPISIRKRNSLHIGEYSSNLGEKLLGDVLVAAGVTFAVSPFLTIIDKAITQRAANTHTIVQSSLDSARTLLCRPVSFIKSPTFLMMWGVYASTYSTANCLKTYFEHREQHDKRMQERERAGARVSKRIACNDASTTAVHSDNASFGKIGILAGTTFVNSFTSILKDRAYAQMFGTAGSAQKVPRITMGLWAVRDCMVVGSSFILPEIVSSVLQEQASMNKTDALRISQIACPVATQFVAGPVQLLGLDFYNRPLSSATDRLNFLSRNFSSIVGARVARIVPGYGIGGIGNTYFRDAWRDGLTQRRAHNFEHEDATELLGRKSAQPL